MATVEAWTLDGVALMGGNFDILELNVDPPKARQDWISAADSESAALLRQPLHENRTITMKVRVTSQASMNAALDQVGVILDKFRKASATPDGVALTWTPANSTRTVTFDVIAGEMTEVPIGLADQAWSWFKQRPIMTLEMTAKPYWRGSEVLTSTASSSTPFVTLEVASVPGDIPALGRLIVTDTATQNRRHVEWGLENQYYDNTTSLLVDSDNMTVSGFSGATATTTGAYDPNATGANSITASVLATPVSVAGTGNLTHVGSFRVKARIQASVADLMTRLSWQQADGPFTSNPYVAPPITGDWCEVDLGTILIAPTIAGTQRWTGRIDAYSTTGGTLIVDYLILVPLEGYGRARATYHSLPNVLTGHDEFTATTAGSGLNARVAPQGGTWATSGATTDLVFYDAATGGGELVTRSTISDSGQGRQAILGATNYTDIDVGVDVSVNGGLSASTAPEGGVVARWVDASNFIRAKIAGSNITLTYSFVVETVIGGVTTTIATIPAPTFPAWRTRLIIYANGRFRAELSGPGGALLRILEGINTALATGGTLATGKPGFFDRHTGTAAGLGRFYDNYAQGTPSTEPMAVYSGRSLQVRYDTTIRQDSTGTYYGPPESYRGSRFLVPTGTSRVLVKARRADVEAHPDVNVTDATQIQVGYQPRCLAVPRV